MFDPDNKSTAQRKKQLVVHGHIMSERAPHPPFTGQRPQTRITADVLPLRLISLFLTGSTNVSDVSDWRDVTLQTRASGISLLSNTNIQSFGFILGRQSFC